MRDDVHELLRIAKDAARAGADVHLSARQRGFAVRSKQTPADLVTDVDRESERQVVSFLRAARPDDAIVGEEGSDVAGGSGVCWIIDPLDGTTNFVHGYPAHAVAVGVEIDGRRALGVVCDTFHNRLYEGIVGGPARCDEAPIADPPTNYLGNYR